MKELSSLTNITKNPVKSIEEASRLLENANGGDVSASVNEINTALNIIKNTSTIADSLHTIQVIDKKTAVPPSPEESFAITIEKRGINSFELYFLPILLVSILYLFIIAVFGLFISHKMAGPIYRIKKTLLEASKGNVNIKELEFRLRKRDELQDLVDALNKFLDKIYDRMK